MEGVTRSMTEQPRVSVVINNYNYGRFVGQCVESALNQTAKCEVIVVDDGSTDESSAVLAEFGNSIIVLRQENKGQAAAMNIGIARASGDVIAFLDADDFMHPNRVDRVRAAFAEDPSIGWLRHNMTSVDEAGQFLAESLYPTDEPSTPVTDIVSFGDTWGATSGLCFSRVLLERIGSIPEEVYGYGGDCYLILAGGLAGKCRTLPESLCARRRHAQQLTNRGRPTPGYVRKLITMRANMALTAARLAPNSPESACLRDGAAWWQRKAALQHSRLDREPLRARYELWRAYTSSLHNGPLPSREKIAFALRDTALAMTPAPTFETLWWWTHDGRPLLRHRRTRSSGQ
jgi:GT2 family glycosyltransferase